MAGKSFRVGYFIFSSLPSSVTILAGDWGTQFSVTVSGSLGDEASITASSGSSQGTASVEIVGQSWRTIPQLVVHKGGALNLYGLFEHRLRTAATITATSSLPAIASLTATSDVVPALSNRTGFEINGVSTGTSTITLTVGGLPQITSQVTVVDNEISVTATELKVLGVAPGSSGKVVFALAGGGVFQTASLSANAVGFVTVDGAGTGELVLDFNGENTTLLDATVTVSLDSSGSGEHPIGVLDLVHHGDDPWLNNYYLIKPASE